MIRTSAAHSDKLAIADNIRRAGHNDIVVEHYDRHNLGTTKFDWQSKEISLFVRKNIPDRRNSYTKSDVKGDLSWQGNLPENQVLIIPKGARVFGTIQGDCDQKYSAVFLKQEKLFHNLDDCLDYSKILLDATYFNDDAMLSSLLSSLTQTFDATDPLSRLYTDSLLSFTGMHIAKNYSNASKLNTPPKGGLSNHNLNMVYDFIESNLSEIPPLADIADLANLTPFHFSRCFKKSAGLTLTDYVSKRRVKRACDLLKSTPKTITEIALIVGYSNLNRLNENFRKELGMTPRQYRKINE
ncbi:MAG: AraC family transcriptional regulator [Emcibacteraceae bacterium]|nr:AraC family transcriptional regulator [Emcibacteraceae bacterium]